MAQVRRHHTLRGELVSRCACRMMIENVLAQPINFFRMDTLFSVVQAKVDTDLRFTLMAGSLYRHLSRTCGNRHWPCRTRQISNHILLTDATIRICQSCIEVLLGRRANPALLAAGLQAARAATRRSDHAKALESLRELDQNPRKREHAPRESVTQCGAIHPAASPNDK